MFLLLGTGTWATINHMPTLNALWLTGYGVAILVKIGLLAAAMALGAGNLLRTKPRLAAARERPELGEPAAGLLRRMISGEALLIASAVFAAAVLSSLAPPPPAFALQNSALASVGPGRVAETVHQAGYVLQVLVSPNKAVAPDSFALRITKNGQPVRAASVTLTFNHTEMQMPQQEYQLNRNPTRCLLPRRAGARDGRQMGARVPDHPQERPAVHRPDPRPGQRMTNPEPQPTSVRLRLLAATLGLALGVAAIVIALLFLKGALA